MMGDYGNALSSLKQVLEIFKISIPSNQLLVATTYSNMADLYDKLGEYIKAIEHAEQSVDFACHTLGDEHAETKKFRNYFNQLQHKYNDGERFD
jgi:tetratricopeptide (TPR) repeat protein